MLSLFFIFEMAFFEKNVSILC